MFFVAALLTILSGLFSAARPREIGSLGVAMCRYAAPFATIRCSWLVAAGEGWGAFVSVRCRARSEARGLWS
jgi:hypothetical protein